MLASYGGLICQAAQRWRHILEAVGHEWEDIHQEARMAALRAVRAWRPGRGAGPCKYIVTYVETALFNARARAVRVCRGGGRRPVSLEAVGGDVCDLRSEPPEDEASRRLEREEVLEPILRDLESYCPTMALVTRLHWLEGMTQPQIGRVIARHKVTVRQILARAMSRMREVAAQRWRNVR